MLGWVRLGPARPLARVSVLLTVRRRRVLRFRSVGLQPEAGPEVEDGPELVWVRGHVDLYDRFGARPAAQMSDLGHRTRSSCSRRDVAECREAIQDMEKRLEETERADALRPSPALLSNPTWQKP